MRKLLPAVVLAPALAFGWGFDGHRKLASMLQDGIPAGHCLRQWYSARQTYTLQNMACDPDRWRDPANAAYDPAEAPRHFLEIDRISPTTAYPRDWAAVIATFPNYYDANGKVPWRVEEMYGQLVDAFRAKDVTRVLNTTFVMSHYVTDSFSVLHDTRYFNPGGTLHTRWESTMLGVSSQIAEITTLAQGYRGTAGRADPRNNVFDVVLTGNGLAPQLTTWNTMYPSPDETGFFNACKDYTARRWGDAITLLSSLVWTAWAEAGSPALTGFPTSGCSMAAPTSEIVFRGWPVAGGFSHPDGGSSMQPPDASVVIDDGGETDAGCLDGCSEPDAGSGGGAGGGSSGGGFGGGDVGQGGGASGGVMDPQDPLCGCGASPGAVALLLAVALAWRKRR